uniref:Zinc finger PHD-type domain-containing protein n=1 Tax=Cannabis sativa TaxID=3483 RepID=A0A803QIF0_CANSA
MKTKSHGGKSRPLSTPSSHSPRLPVLTPSRFRALPILLNQENGNEKLESTPVIFFCEGDNDDDRGVNSESSPQTVKNGGGMSMTPQFTGSWSEDSMELDSLEEGETCFRCKGRDKRVRVCSEIGCLIAVHDECMGCEPTFDDLGLFYCPYFDRNACDTLPSASGGIHCNNENVPFPNDLEIQSLAVDEKEMDDAQVGCHDQDKLVIEKEIQPSTFVANGADNVGCGEGTAVRINKLQGSSAKDPSINDGEDGKEEDSGPMDDSKDERIVEENEEREILDTSEIAGEVIIDDADIEKRATKKLLREAKIVEEDEEQILTESSDGIDKSETESRVNRHRRFKQRAGKTVCSENVTLPKRSSPRLWKSVARHKSTTKKNALLFNEKNTTSEKSQQALKLV